MFYTTAGPAPAEPGLLAREIDRRTGIADLPPQLTSLAVGAGDGYLAADLEFVRELREVDPHVVAFAISETFLVTSVQEMGATMLRGDDLVRVPHGIFRVPAWGQRTFFAGATAEFVGRHVELAEAGRFVEPRRFRRRVGERPA